MSHVLWDLHFMAQVFTFELIILIYILDLQRKSYYIKLGRVRGVFRICAARIY